VDTPQIYTPTDPVNLHPLVGVTQGIAGHIFSAGFAGFLYTILVLLVIGLITLILYLFVRMYEIKLEDDKKAAVLAKSLVAVPAATVEGGVSAGLPENKTWKHIRGQLLSDSPSDWKLGIIEADIYMDKVLDDKGFHGDTTGDKLKQVTPDKLPSISIAWEVHKIRNNIAHQGAAFVLTMPEARRLLGYYEMIFTDLGVL